MDAAELSAIAKSQLEMRPRRGVIDALQRQLDGSEAVRSMAYAYGPGAEGGDVAIAVATDRRLIVVPNNRKNVCCYRFEDLLDLASWRDPERRGFTILTPVLGAALGESIRLKDAGSARISGVFNDAHAREDDGSTLPRGYGVYLPRATILLSSEPPFQEQTRVTVTATAAGIRLGARPRLVVLIPLHEIRRLSIEGLDQVQSRPSVAAVVAFGVLGLAARKKERFSYLTLKTVRGESVIEVEDRLPTELRSALAPLHSACEPSVLGRDTNAALPDPIDEIRRLGELRAEGLITEDEFADAKAVLLRKVRREE